MTRSEDLKAWSISFLISSGVLFLSFWLGKVSQLQLTPSTSMGEGTVIEITLPPIEKPQEVKPAPQQRLETKKEEKRVTKQRAVKEVRQTPIQEKAENFEKPSPPIPQERAILEPVKEQAQAQASPPAQPAPPAPQPQESPPLPAPSPAPPPPQAKPQQQETASSPAQIQARRPTAGEENELINYFARIKTLVERNKRYPQEARRRGQEGTVVLRISIREDGSLGSVSIVKSSGYSSLDGETLRVIRSIGRFPPPPGGRPIEFNLEVEYKLGG